MALGQELGSSFLFFDTLLLPVLAVLFSFCAVIKTILIKSKQGKKGFIWLIIPDPGNSGQELKQEQR